MMLALRTIAAMAGWLACVVGARAEMPLVGPALVAVMLVAHTATLADPVRQFRPLVLIGVLGTLAESAWIAAGAYAPIDAMRGSLLCPLWITAAWLNLAVYLQGVLGERSLLPEGDTPADTLPNGGARLDRNLALRWAPLAGAVAMPAAYALAAAVGAIYVDWRPAPALAGAAAYGAAIAPLAVWLIDGRNSRLASSQSPAKHESTHG